MKRKKSILIVFLSVFLFFCLHCLQSVENFQVDDTENSCKLRNNKIDSGEQKSKDDLDSSSSSDDSDGYYSADSDGYFTPDNKNDASSHTDDDDESDRSSHTDDNDKSDISRLCCSLDKTFWNENRLISVACAAGTFLVTNIACNYLFKGCRENLTQFFLRKKNLSTSDRERRICYAKKVFYAIQLLLSVGTSIAAYNIAFWFLNEEKPTILNV